MSQVRSRKLRRRRRKEANKTLRRKVEIRVDGQVLVICTWHSKICHCFRDFCENPKFVDGFFLFISSNTKVLGGNSICSKSFFWWIALVIGRRWFAHNQCSWDDHLPKKIIWTMVHATRERCRGPSKMKGIRDESCCIAIFCFSSYTFSDLVFKLPRHESWSWRVLEVVLFFGTFGHLLPMG